MRAFIIFLLALSITACSKKVSKTDLQHLNGYWEIEKVVFPEGGSKEYDLNTTIDYITFENDKGYRKKVHPKPGGGFNTSDDAEPFTLFEQDGVFFLQYKNDLSTWEDQIEQITASNFTVVNKENIRYYYRRYTPQEMKQ